MLDAPLDAQEYLTVSLSLLPNQAKSSAISPCIDCRCIINWYGVRIDKNDATYLTIRDITATKNTNINRSNAIQLLLVFNEHLPFAKRVTKMSLYHCQLAISHTRCTCHAFRMVVHSNHSAAGTVLVQISHTKDERGPLPKLVISIKHVLCVGQLHPCTI